MSPMEAHHPKTGSYFFPVPMQLKINQVNPSKIKWEGLLGILLAFKLFLQVVDDDLAIFR
jgi:hypothetical protein